MLPKPYISNHLLLKYGQNYVFDLDLSPSRHGSALHRTIFLNSVLFTSAIYVTSLLQHIATKFLLFKLHYLVVLKKLVFSICFRQQRKFNKKSGRWSVTEVKNKKTYYHIPDFISLIVRVRLEDKEGMHKKVALKPDDPRLISKTLARVPPHQHLS